MELSPKLVYTFDLRRKKKKKKKWNRRYQNTRRWLLPRQIKKIFSHVEFCLPRERYDTTKDWTKAYWGEGTFWIFGPSQDEGFVSIALRKSSHTPPNSIFHMTSLMTLFVFIYIYILYIYIYTYKMRRLPHRMAPAKKNRKSSFTHAMYIRESCQNCPLNGSREGSFFGVCSPNLCPFSLDDFPAIPPR